MMMTDLFRKTGTVLGTAVLLCLSSCERIEIDEAQPAPAKTILAYFSADNPSNNDLFPFLAVNLKDMAAGLSGPDYSNCNILAFIDGPSSGINKTTSYFLDIHDGKMERVFTFNAANVKDYDPKIDANQDGNLDSSNPATLKMAINYMLEHYPNREYGLIMWSHGGGWIPGDKWFEITKPHYKYSMSSSVSQSAPASSASVSASGLPLITKNDMQTRYFAYEPAPNGKNNTMELKDMVTAIPDRLFDFILFDACYMGCVEVAYALKDKARYFISSTTEIMGSGFPYRSVTGKLARGYLMGACRDFYSYYNSFNNYCRLGEVSLVRTDELDSLANCFKKIVTGKPDASRSDKSFKNIQNFDRFWYSDEDRSVFFDLGAVARTYSKSEADYDEFRKQLDRCVLYAATTPELFIYCPGLFDKKDLIEVKEFSGLSVYIPFKDNDSFGLNDSYAQLEWSKATNYK